jgi:hypothetical protein
MSDRDNELDSLMMQADIANQEAKPRRTRPALDPNAANPREPFVAVPIEEGDVFSHTPGPWGAEPSLVGFAIMVNDRFVGEIQKHADAKLVAAAPELLAALREIIASFDKDMSGMVIAKLNGMRAIAKATKEEA